MLVFSRQYSHFIKSNTVLAHHIANKTLSPSNHTSSPQKVCSFLKKHLNITSWFYILTMHTEIINQTNLRYGVLI